MEATNNQPVDGTNRRTDAVTSRKSAEKKRTDAGRSRKSAKKAPPGESSDCSSKTILVNLAQINIQNIVYDGRQSYNNGQFIPVFQDAIRAIACNSFVKPGTRRVLLYILGTVDEKNCFYEGLSDMATNIGCSEDTVERALKQLVSMHIICKKTGARERGLYELSDKMLNPRIAFKGNTRKLRKEDLPPILAPDSVMPLIPNAFITNEFETTPEETDAK